MAQGKTQVNLGDIYNSWKLIEEPYLGSPRTQALWLCLGCEKTTKRSRPYEIVSGKSKSCGCQKSLNTQKQFLKTREKEGIYVGAKISGWKILSCPPGPLLVCLCLGCEITVREHLVGTIRLGKSKSCGCLRKQLTNKAWSKNDTKRNRIKRGNRFGDWTVLEIVDKHLLCKCICGVTQLVYNGTLHRGLSRSCGCQNKKYTTESSLEKYGSSMWCTSTTGREAKTTAKLEDGTPIRALCRRYGVPYSTAYLLYKQQGEKALRTYSENYNGQRVFSTELRIIELLKELMVEKYDKQPIEFKCRYRPDFRFEVSETQRVLYVNTDGLYWHSIGRELSNNYHKLMGEVFKMNNQMIFQFREDELRDKGEIVRSIILNYLGIVKRRYVARKCIFKELDTKEDRASAKQFFKDNHLMGNGSGKTFGLFFQGELVAAMSLRKKDSELDISRFCTKRETSVVGGFSKLLKNIIKVYSPTSIQSFCDLRYGSGDSYLKQGFELTGTTQGWQWTDFHNTFNRLKCRANMDDRKLTQAEYAEEKGLVKIYDAGQAKFVLNIEKSATK